MTHSGAPTLLGARYLAAKFEHPERSQDVAERFAALVTLPEDWQPTLIVPVPSSTPIARDFAVALADRLGIPVDTGVLVWQREVPPLKRQPVAARAGLVRDAFAAAPVTGTVLLVDDVVRSGATFAEAARTLRNAGAARVECLAMLRVRTASATRPVAGRCDR